MKLFLMNGKTNQEDHSNINNNFEKKDISYKKQSIKSPELLYVREHKIPNNPIGKLKYLKLKKEQTSKERKNSLLNNNNENFSNLNINNNIENIDEDLLKSWEILKVTETFKQRFINKLQYFAPNIQELIIKKEKENLKKIFDKISKITSEHIKRERAINELRTLEAIFQSGRESFSINELLNHAKIYLNNLKISHINIFSCLLDLQKIFIYDSNHGKYDKSKLPCRYLLEDDFFIKLNDDLIFLKDSMIGAKLNMKSLFDPLFLCEDFDKPIDMRNVSDACYALMNGLIYTNYNIPKKYRPNKKTTIKNYQKVNIDAGGNKNTTKFSANKHIPRERNEIFEKISNDHSKEEKILKGKETIECKSKNEKEKEKKNIEITKIKEFEKYSNKNNHIIIESDRLPTNRSEAEKKGLYFYREKISDLEKLYNDFYEEVPETLKTTFNLKKDINFYSNGIYPMIIIEKENNKLISFISLSVSTEKPNALSLKTICTLKNLKDCFNNLFNLLKENKINFHLLLLDLFYEFKDGKYTLDQEINLLICKILKFRWMKLENLSNGFRYQQLKYTNPEFNSENQKDIITYFFKMRSSLLLTTGDQNENCEKACDNNINLLNLQICENVFAKKEEEIQKIYSCIRNMDFQEENVIGKIYNKMKELGIEVNENNLPEKILNNIWSYFSIEINVDSISFIHINNNKYIRIKTEIQSLFDKETHQKYYIITTKDSNMILLSSMNDESKEKLINDYGNNLYSYFKDLYPKLEPPESSTRGANVLLVPEYEFLQNSRVNNINSGIIKNIINADFFTDIVTNKEENTKNFPSINYDVNENDIILEKPLFIAGINIDLSIDNPTLFCYLITK